MKLLNFKIIWQFFILFVVICQLKAAPHYQIIFNHHGQGMATVRSGGRFVGGWTAGGPREIRNIFGRTRVLYWVSNGKEPNTPRYARLGDYGSWFLSPRFNPTPADQIVEFKLVANSGTFTVFAIGEDGSKIHVLNKGGEQVSSIYGSLPARTVQIRIEWQGSTGRIIGVRTSNVGKIYSITIKPHPKKAQFIGMFNPVGVAPFCNSIANTLLRLVNNRLSITNINNNGGFGQYHVMNGGYVAGAKAVVFDSTRKRYVVVGNTRPVVFARRVNDAGNSFIGAWDRVDNFRTNLINSNDKAYTYDSGFGNGRLIILRANGQLYSINFNANGKFGPRTWLLSSSITLPRATSITYANTGSEDYLVFNDFGTLKYARILDNGTLDTLQTTLFPSINSSAQLVYNNSNKALYIINNGSINRNNLPYNILLNLIGFLTHGAVYKREL